MKRAIHYPNLNKFRADQTPGSLYVPALAAGDTGAMQFFCPCGCGARSVITVGAETKPRGFPSWQWNGSALAATLAPSIKQTRCGWHGFLRDGYWEEV